jgi:hypothetical protein
VNRFFSVTVVAMDLTHLSVHLAAGTVDPKPPKAARALATGQVPPEHLDSLVAVFNGGFQERHGRWGMRVAGQTFLEARPDGCTIALYTDETVRIASWPRLEGGGTPVGQPAPAAPAKPVAFRQTPPCLVEDGAVHPRLVAGNDRAWGGHTKDVTTRRRSAIGIDAKGRVLFYGVSVEAPARYLAEGLRVAGCASAAQLDINWNWTRFLLVGEPQEGGLQVTSTLVPGMPHGKYEYVKRPSARDFFYVRTRGAKR